jgi:hypothetical protein
MMHTDKHDRYVWIFLGLVVVALTFWASGCRSRAEWQAAMLSTRLGYEIGDGTVDSRGGKANNDTDYQAVTVSIQPFQLWAWRAQADINARAILEQRYAERPPPKPVQGPILPVPK